MTFLLLALPCLGYVLDEPLPWVNQPEWQWMMLDGINRRRALHDSPPLMWSTAAAVDGLRNAQKFEFGHDPPQGRKYMDNIGSTDTPDGMFITWGFYEQEERRFRYDDPLSKRYGRVGHFAQMVWRHFKYVGCAMAYHPRGDNTGNKYRLACMYGPVQEYLPGWYPANVPPPKSEWPRGWSPPAKSSLSPFNTRMGPPWPGYKWKDKPVPSCSFDVEPPYKMSDLLVPFGEGAPPLGYTKPIWDELKRPRYKEVKRAGGGHVRIWEDPSTHGGGAHSVGSSSGSHSGRSGRASSSSTSWQEKYADDFGDANAGSESWPTWLDRFAGDIVDDDADLNALIARASTREDTSGDEELARMLQASLGFEGS